MHECQPDLNPQSESANTQFKQKQHPQSYDIRKKETKVHSSVLP